MLSIFFDSTSTRPHRQTKGLILLTLFCILLIICRALQCGIQVSQVHSLEYIIENKRCLRFGFMPWNLFLAWIPYALSIRLSVNARRTIQWGIFAFWLLFFPNAAYIVTDFVHLRKSGTIPLWYDLFILFSCAITGVLLSLLSLRHVQVFLAKVSPLTAFWHVAFCSYAAAFGIFIGRFLRFNSWDIIFRPLHLFQQTMDICMQLDIWLFTVVLGTLLLLLYQICWTSHSE